MTIELNETSFEIADSHSFYYSHREIFIDEIYKFRTNKNAPVILDCGSNYGTSIVYFKQIYPNSKIVGIEADPTIYKLLQCNIENQNFTDVQLLNRAVSAKKGIIKFFSEGADGGRIHRIDDDTQTYEVKTITLDDLIDGQVDFIKMDIEGAETDVILGSKKLNQVDQMFIEYHSFVDVPQQLGDLLTCLTKNNFRYYIHTQFCSERPLSETRTQLGMDMQLNIFAKRTPS